MFFVLKKFSVHQFEPSHNIVMIIEHFSTNEKTATFVLGKRENCTNLQVCYIICYIL